MAAKKGKKPGFMKDAPPFMKGGDKKKKKAGVGVKKGSKKPSK